MMLIFSYINFININKFNINARSKTKKENVNKENSNKDESDLGLTVDAKQFENLEREFQEVKIKQILEGISGDSNLDKFRIQYERLYRAFKFSFENEKRLLSKCKELNDIILNNAAKIKAALDMSKEDANTIKKLQTEVDKAWKLIEQAKDKDDKAKKMIIDLKEEISQLNKIVDQGSGLSMGHDQTVNDLLRSKD